jgi:hypothetical protein
LELFKRAGSRVIGTVLNRIPRNRAYYYGGYKYYSAYSKDGYYGQNGREPIQEPVPETPSITSETVPSYSFLSRVARSAKSPDELPPPDPPKN